jgi:amino acid permease
MKDSERIDDFEITMQKNLIDHYKRNSMTYIFLMVVSLAVIIMDISILRFNPERWSNAFTAGMCFFNFIFVFQQYMFNRNDYKFARQKLERMERWKEEEKTLMKDFNDKVMQSYGAAINET